MQKSASLLSRLLRPVVIPIATALVLGGCAGGPKFDREQYHQRVTPKVAARDFITWQGDSVLWGGLIVGMRNLDDGSQLEVLAYPLTRNQLPDTTVESSGRFLALSDAFLEPVDYAEGRLVTMTGVLDELADAKLGSVTTAYPVLRIGQLHLWSEGAASREPRVHFGFGFIFSN